MDISYVVPAQSRTANMAIKTLPYILVLSCLILVIPVNHIQYPQIVTSVLKGCLVHLNKGLISNVCKCCHHN